MENQASSTIEAEQWIITWINNGPVHNCRNRLSGFVECSLVLVDVDAISPHAVYEARAIHSSFFPFSEFSYLIGQSPWCALDGMLRLQPFLTIQTHNAFWISNSFTESASDYHRLQVNLSSVHAYPKAVCAAFVHIKIQHIVHIDPSFGTFDIMFSWVRDDNASLYMVKRVSLTWMIHPGWFISHSWEYWVLSSRSHLLLL